MATYGVYVWKSNNLEIDDPREIGLTPTFIEMNIYPMTFKEEKNADD